MIINFGHIKGRIETNFVLRFKKKECVQKMSENIFSCRFCSRVSVLCVNKKFNATSMTKNLRESKNE